MNHISASVINPGLERVSFLHSLWMCRKAAALVASSLHVSCRNANRCSSADVASRRPSRQARRAAGVTAGLQQLDSCASTTWKEPREQNWPGRKKTVWKLPVCPIMLGWFLLNRELWTFLGISKVCTTLWVNIFFLNFILKVLTGQTLCVWKAVHFLRTLLRGTKTWPHRCKSNINFVLVWWMLSTALRL